MQNLCSLLTDAFPIKGFYNAELVFWVAMLKMQRLLMQLLELFI